MVAGTLALFKFRLVNYRHLPWILDGVDMSHLCQPVRSYSLIERAFTETGFAAPLPPMPPLVPAPWAYPMAMQQQAVTETSVRAIP